MSRYESMDLIAHKTDTGEEQSLLDHLMGTAIQARRFAEIFGCGNMGELLGLYHDIGKCSKEWQRYIRDPKHKGRVDHSSAGAIEINKSNYELKIIFAYCVMGHHSGLLDYGNPYIIEESGTLQGRLASSRVRLLPEYDEGLSELHLKVFEREDLRPIPLKRFAPVQNNQGEKSFDGFMFYTLTKMLFSSLVDADFLDTEAFMDLQRAGARNAGCNKTPELLLEMLQKYITDTFKGKEGDLNSIRSSILQECILGAKKNKGMYTLTVPTGGGKTIASVAYALTHAVHHNMQRVIYVIPYTSIIEQTATQFEEIFGKDQVLQHHSNYDFSDQNENGGESDIEYRKKLASENWDIPIVVTTAVQFFESFFANRTSRCRKLHNIVNSVIVFDEAQMLPLEYMRLCTQCIAELTYNYNCTALLCTATQPAIKTFLPKEVQPEALVSVMSEWKQVFRRVTYRNMGKCSNEEIVRQIKDQQQVLVIVNTKRHALDLYEGIKGLPGAIHLSAAMCGIHRSKTVNEIKRRLTAQEPCRVIATRLVEAGVDLDFPCVIKAIAGLDSIIQAAGRCNREGRMEGPGNVCVFQPVEEQDGINYMPKAFRMEAEVARQIMDRNDDFTSEEAIKDFFETLYSFKGDETFDKNRLFESIQQGVTKGASINELFHYDFKTVAEKFRFIDETYTLIIPYDSDAEKMIAKAHGIGMYTREILRSLQKYVVNVYKEQFESLMQGGAMEVVGDRTGVLLDMNRYRDETGIEHHIEPLGQAVIY